MTASVHQINVSDGGVPKLPIERAWVGNRGIDGDRQEDTKHHGSPDQALCLWSLEVITELQAEGHPIEPGNAGENLTIRGLEWSDVNRGDRFFVGDTVLIEITWPAIPCGKNSRWFADQNHRRIHHELHPGDARWYAKVVSGGSIQTGDAVRPA